MPAASTEPAATAQTASQQLAPSTQASAVTPISLTSAVDLALHLNPRVQMALADVARARALLDESHDAYIPSLTAGAGLGEAYGYSPNPPTLFTFSGGSLIYSASQSFYLRSARAGVAASRFALEDVRESVAEDAALAFLILDHDQQRESIIRQQMESANKLVAIVQARVDAGQDRQMDLTQAKLTGAQFRLNILHAQNDVANDRDHLARLIGIPLGALTIESTFPSAPMPVVEQALAGQDGTGDALQEVANPAISSAFANAEAKRQQALGDTKYRYRPQLNLVAQYNRYATFTDSFAALQNLYQVNGRTTLKPNEGVFGVQVTLPVFDKFHAAKARENAADASHALHEAQIAQIQFLDGHGRLRHSLLELQARSEVAALEQQLAQQQLDVLLLQLESGNPGGPPLTPKDEQDSRIAEQEKHLGVADSTFQLRQAEIQFLRQTGQLNAWLRAAGAKVAP